METQRKTGGNPAALLPILVFLALYLGMGLIFEYRLHIYQGFYNIPIVVVFLVALAVACFQNRTLKFDDKLAVMAQGVGDKNIMTMILIFLVAGVFVGVTGRSSAEAVVFCQAVDLLLSQSPVLDPVAVGVFGLEYHGPASGQRSLKIRLPGLYVAGEELALPVGRP